MVPGAVEIEKDAESRLKIISFMGGKLPPCYHSVILSAWLNSLWKLNKFFKMIERSDFFNHYEKFVKAIIVRPNVKIRLAVLEEDPDIVFGWSVAEGTVLHYVHIKEPYRKQKLSHDLIPKNLSCITHVTKHWEEFFMKKSNGRYSKNVKFNPFQYEE